MFGGISVNIKELEAVIEAILFTMGEAVEVADRGRCRARRGYDPPAHTEYDDPL